MGLAMLERRTSNLRRERTHVRVFAALCSNMYTRCVSKYMGVCFCVHIVRVSSLLCICLLCVLVSDYECMSVFVCVCV